MSGGGKKRGGRWRERVSLKTWEYIRRRRILREHKRIRVLMKLSRYENYDQTPPPVQNPKDGMPYVEKLRMQLTARF